MSNITEELFGAIKLITDNAINKISLDKTIICRITDASKKSEGKYRVQNGDVSFYAFSEDATYAKDDEVRVVVPGDDTKQKYILGKYVKDDGSPVNYVSPADSVINISGNILSDNNNADRGFIAAKNAKEVYGIDTKLSGAANILNTVYDTLVIEGDFRTLLQEDRKGEYGIDVVIYGQKGEVTYAQQYTLSSRDMFGDPYNFQIYTPQAKAFSLTNDFGEGVNVVGVVVGFYQQGFSKEYDYDNVLIRDLSVWFGSDTSKVEDKTSKIYTTDSLSYKYFDSTDATNEKTINLLWYKKDENDNYVECTFGGTGFGDLQSQQTTNKIKAQMGKESGPTQLRQLYAAAAYSDNNKTVSTYVSLVKSDIQQLIRSMESEAGLEEGTLKNDGSKLSEIGSKITEFTIALSNQLKEWSTADTWSNNSAGINLCNKNALILTTLDTFFNSDPANENSVSAAMAKATGVFNQYAAKWKILANKIEKAYAKIHVLGFGNTEFNDMIGSQWTVEVAIDKDGKIVNKDTVTAATASTDSDSTESADASYSCYWFVYDEQCDDDDIYTQVAGQHWKHIEGEDNKTSIEYKCDPVLETQLFKCIVFEDASYYESNILEFTNSDDIPNGATLDQADSLILVHGEKYSRDSYLLYGDDGYIIDNKDSSLTRTIACEYDGVKAGNEALNGAVVYWYLPKAGTMLRKAYTKDEDYKTKCGLVIQGEECTAASKYPNHYCYSRTIEMAKKKDESGNELDEYEFVDKSNEFYYHLAEFFEPNAGDNSIICEVYLLDETKTASDPVYAQQWFTIGQKGTCGTGYTLSVTHVDDQVATTDDSNLQLKVQLFDENGNEATISDLTVAWEESTNCSGKKLSHTNNSNGLSLSDNIITVSSGTYGILKVSCVVYIPSSSGTSQRLVDLTTLYAVPWTKSSNYLFTGCTKVIYTTLGALDYTNMYRTAYSILNRSTGEDVSIFCEMEKIGGQDDTYFPNIKNNCLVPADMYLTGLCGWCSVIISSGGSVIWKQPIIVMQSKYGSSILNNWDGSFQINEDAGTIFGTMFAAGKKTNNNTFEGVIMGDVQDGLQNSKAGGTGIYGYNDGIESFGLKIDGTAFFGKSGSGQILINGNKGTVRSSEWIENVGWGDGSKWRDSCKGMEIDFDDATIRMVGDTTDYATTEDGEYVYEVTNNERKKVVNKNGTIAPNIIITARPQDTDKTYFEIQGVKKNATEDGATTWELSSLMKVGQEDYYLQSLGFDDEKHLGTKIDIGKGTITSYDFKINAFGGDPSEQTILLNSNPEELDDCYFKIGKDSGSFISFTKNGALDIYANKLTLASPLSSANLLRNTGPCERPKYKTDEDGNEIFDASGNKILLPLTYGWDGGEAYYATEGTRTCVEFNGDPSQSDVNIAKDKWYTISGELLSGSFNFYTASVAQEFSTIGRFEYTFQANENATYIDFNGDACVYHLKLEQNTSATPWCEHIDDAKQYAKDKDDEYDEQLLQDQVFAKLTNNGDSRGIFLEGGQLYINADYLSTGIIRSSNWKGSYSGPDGKTYETAEEYLQAKEEGLRSKEEAVRKKWDGFTPKITATDGMYINLNDGKIWAKTLLVSAWTDDDKGGIYLNSSPENDYYLRIGDNENHIYFHSTNGMTFQAKSGFLVNTIPSGGAGDDTKFLYLNSTGNGNITTGDGNEYKGIYFGVGQLGGENSSYAIYGNGKFTIKGRIEADEGKIGKMSIENDGVYISDINEQIKYSDDSISVCTVPFLAGQSLTADFRGYSSTWSKTYSESAQVKWIGEGLDSVNDSLQSKCRVDFQFANGYSDYDSSQIYITFPNISITRYENSKYIKTITVQIQPKNKDAGFSPGDGWQLVGQIKFSIGINQSGITSITPYGVTARTLDGLDITLIRDDINYIKNNLGLSQSSDNSTSFSSANSFNEIKFITYNSSGDQITNAPKICGEPSADGTKGALLLSDTIIGGEFLVRKSEDKTAIMSVKSGYSYFNFTDSIDFKVLNGRTVLQLTPEETYFNIGSTGSLLIKTNSSQAKFYNVDSKVGLLVPSILSAKIAYTNNTSLIELSTDTVSIIKALKVTGNLDAEGGLSVNGGKQASFSGNVIIDGTITNNGHSAKLGKLAFADYVKKKLDVTMTGDVTLTTDISDKLSSYEYTVVTNASAGSWVTDNGISYSGEVPFTYTDVNGDSQTVQVPYSGTTSYTYWRPNPTTTTYTGTNYTGDSNISITKSVTLKGTSDEIEFGPSDTDTGTESITIAGTQQ